MRTATNSEFGMLSHTAWKDSLQFRSAKADDLSSVFASLQKLYEHLNEDCVVSLESFRSFFIDGLFEVILAEDANGTIAGMALYYFDYTPDGHNMLFLEALFVDASIRHQKIGFSLFVHLAAIARSHGCDTVHWQCPRTNETGLQFYRRLGARRSGLQSFLLRPQGGREAPQLLRSGTGELRSHRSLLGECRTPRRGTGVLLRAYRETEDRRALRQLLIATIGHAWDVPHEDTHHGLYVAVEPTSGALLGAVGYTVRFSCLHSRSLRVKLLVFPEEHSWARTALLRFVSLIAETTDCCPTTEAMETSASALRDSSGVEIYSDLVWLCIGSEELRSAAAVGLGTTPSAARFTD